MSEQKVYANTIIMMQALEKLENIYFDLKDLEIQSVYLYEESWKNDSTCADKDSIG